jgi:hypothetical protein
LFVLFVIQKRRAGLAPSFLPFFFFFFFFFFFTTHQGSVSVSCFETTKGVSEQRLGGQIETKIGREDYGYGRE